jgi:chemotaxis protein MotB
MNGNRLLAGSAILVAALALGGCVTQGTYDQLEAEKNKEIGTLKQEMAALMSEQQALQAKRSELQQQIGALESQRAALEEEKSLLLKSSQQNQAQYDVLVGKLTEEVRKGQLQVRQYKNMLTVDVAEQLFFDSGKASLKDSGKEVLKKVGDTLKGYDNKVIRIIGHTDNVPIAKALQKAFPSNWELSVARATTVLRYLQEVGVPPERMIASGRAEYAPVASNDTAEGRKKNRRIEITLIDRSLDEEIAPTPR